MECLKVSPETEVYKRYSFIQNPLKSFTYLYLLIFLLFSFNITFRKQTLFIQITLKIISTRLLDHVVFFYILTFWFTNLRKPEHHVIWHKLSKLCGQFFKIFYLGAWNIKFTLPRWQANYMIIWSRNVNKRIPMNMMEVSINVSFPPHETIAI